MKVVGYGWIKSGDTLQKAMETYGVTENGLVKGEKDLMSSPDDAKKDFEKAQKKGDHRKSAKPRLFRVVLEDVR